MLSITATMLLMAMGMARYSFQQGFLEFVGGMEKARLQKLAQQLVIEYESNNNDWNWLSEEGLESFIVPQRLNPRPKPNRKGFSGPERNRPSGNLPPPPHRGGPAPPDRRPNQNKSLIPRTAVFSTDGILISGLTNTAKYDTEFNYTLISNGQVVGELRSWPNIEGSSELSSIFARQQFWSSIGIAVFCLILAGGISWLLSRKLLIPIHQLRTAIAKLDSGKYGDRVSSERNDELGELMNNVDSLSQTLAKNRSSRNRLFADISHELRTPLTVLAGEIELLKAGIRPFDQKQLLSLEQESDLLRHLVDDLYQLSLSDVGALKYNFTDSDISSVLIRAINNLQQQATAKNIKVATNVKANVVIEADEKRIEQLFLNVLANAISYTDDPGHLEITLVDTEGKVLITLIDSAPSVTVEQCLQLFDPLYRLDESRTRRESGAGLGLAICKNIVEAHNGTIVAAPSTIGGLKITISLPMSRRKI